MNKNFTRSTLSIISGLILAVFNSYAQNEPEIVDEIRDDPEGMFPVSPTKLFDALPASPKNWELKRSTGDKRYSLWIESRVVRIYERTIPNKENPEETITYTTKITIKDTGEFPNAIAEYQDFTPEKFEGFEKMFVKKYPAIFVPYGEKDFEVRLLVKNRFIVEYSLQNQPQKFLKEWLKNTKFAALERIPDTKIITLPSQINILKINQLDPKKNKAYPLATTSSTQLRESLEADEIFQKKMLGEIPALPGELDFDFDSER